jgi:hypothetical protein
MALPMTDIERQRRLAEMTRNKGQKWGVDAGTIARGQFGPNSPSGMAASGYAKDAPDQGGSIEGRQRISDSQRDYANQLRGSKAPKGMTAGPYDVYYGPNWGDSLANAGKQVMGGYMAGQANKEDRAIDVDRQLEKAIALEKVDAQQLFENTNATGVLDAAIAKNLQSNLSSQADRASREKIAGQGQAGQNSRDNTELVFIDEEGVPDYSRTRYASPSPEGMIWGNGEIVDEARWQGRDDPNLTASTSGESRGTAAQAKAAFNANMFDDALEDLNYVMDDLGYDPTTGGALLDKYANLNDFTRAASSAEGQMYNSAADSANEAVLRTSTGAAAPDKEKSTYLRTLIPSPFDKQETKQFKMQKLKRINMHLNQLANGGASQSELNAGANSIIREIQLEERAANTMKKKKEGDEWSDSMFDYKIIDGKLAKSPKET